MKKEVSIQLEESYLGFYEEKAYNYDISVSEIIEDVLVRHVDNVIFDSGTKSVLQDMREKLER